MKVFKMYHKFNINNKELNVLKDKINNGHFHLIPAYNYILNERRVK